LSSFGTCLAKVAVVVVVIIDVVDCHIGPDFRQVTRHAGAGRFYSLLPTRPDDDNDDTWFENAVVASKCQ
jgi:hypothetical protein